jgi:rod shape-determining protein MreC
VLTLDKGADYGLKPEMPVITPDGVVGKLREVFPHTSQLLLLNDLTSGAGVTLESTRIRGILQGADGGRISINDLTPDSRIKPGEHVVTSGGDLVFPRGLPVGVIQSIAPDPQHQPYTAIIVQPFANLSRLEEVLVITGLSSTLSEQARQDADQASSTAAAEEARRAADILAQKLPGLDKPIPPVPGAEGASGATGASGTAPQITAIDPNAADRGGLPGIPNSGLPHVQPAQHPDRYSPGAAPPATDLKPGGGPQ